jgi:hypothetical protein
MTWKTKGIWVHLEGSLLAMMVSSIKLIILVRTLEIEIWVIDTKMNLII